MLCGRFLYGERQSTIPEYVVAGRDVQGYLGYGQGAPGALTPDPQPETPRGSELLVGISPATLPPGEGPRFSVETLDAFLVCTSVWTTRLALPTWRGWYIVALFTPFPRNRILHLAFFLLLSSGPRDFLCPLWIGVGVDVGLKVRGRGRTMLRGGLLRGVSTKIFVLLDALNTVGGDQETRQPFQLLVAHPTPADRVWSWGCPMKAYFL